MHTTPLEYGPVPHNSELELPYLEPELLYCTKLTRWPFCLANNELCMFWIYYHYISAKTIPYAMLLKW